MPVCKVCKESKAIREMRQWGGLATETCQACYDAKKAQKGTALIPAPSTEPARTPSPFVIEVAPTMGFSAQIEDNLLVISQTNAKREDDPDNITLSRNEAKVLFKLFGDWALAS
jgi:hypothetical protein